MDAGKEGNSSIFNGRCGVNYRLSAIGEGEYVQCEEQTLSELANQRGANGPSNNLSKTAHIGGSPSWRMYVCADR